MEISFTGQITQSDFLQAQALHRKPDAPFLVVGATSVFMLITTGIASISEPVILSSSWLVLVFLAILTVITWAAPRFQAINNWKNSKILQKPLSGTITPDRIHFDGAYAESNISWEAYIYYQQSPHLVLLYQSPNVMTIFPEGFFNSDSEWASFIQLVKEKVSEKKATSIEKTQKVLLIGFVILLVFLAVSSFVFTIFGLGR